MPADSMELPRLSFTYQEWSSDPSRPFRARSKRAVEVITCAALYKAMTGEKIAAVEA